MKSFYRPEIDGLRAIAVFGVIIYHAQLNILGKNLFQGGFIGVDIFFVISGYLITSFILNEFKKKKFSLIHFYERRARRILPALFTVIILSIPFAWLYLLPNDFIDFFKSIISSIFFWSNHYFYNSGQLYNDGSSLIKPFLHTWSLSVEIQFYIFFPIFLIFCLSFFKKNILKIFFFVFIISLLFSIWCSSNYPSLSFYILITRLWELFAGSILSKLEFDYGRKNYKNIFYTFPLIGIICIIYSFIFFNDKTFHPSFITLIPIIGTCLIIWFSNEKELLTKVLSSKFFVSFGLISYSLYLYHYPIFAFSRITEFATGDNIKKALVVFAILFFSISTYFLVEKPFRNREKLSFKLAFRILISLQIILSLFYYYSIQKNGFKERFPEIILKNLNPIEGNNKNYVKDNCKEKINDFCVLNSNAINGSVFILGDSHIEVIKNSIKTKLIEKKYEVIPIIKYSCWYLPEFNKIDWKTKKTKDSCNADNHEIIKKTILSKKNSIIIIGGRLPLYISSKYFDNQEGGIEWSDSKEGDKFVHTKNKLSLSDGIKISIEELLNNNHKVILIYPIPEVGWNVPKKMIIDMPKNKKFINNFMKSYNLTTSYDVYKNRTYKSFKILDSITHKDLYRVYPHTLFCDNTIKDRCVTHNLKDIFYSDDDHLSIKGSELVSELILDEIYKISLTK